AAKKTPASSSASSGTRSRVTSRIVPAGRATAREPRAESAAHRACCAARGWDDGTLETAVRRASGSVEPGGPPDGPPGDGDLAAPRAPRGAATREDPWTSWSW